MNKQRNTLIMFTFNGTQVRGVTDAQGNPWLCAADAARALRYRDQAGAIRKHCKHAKPLKDLASAISQEGELPGNALFIPEPDLYRLTIRSKLPEAQRFEAWVFDEVLPAIRKHGHYHALINLMLLPAPRPWERRFPPEFYRELCRLYGWTYKPGWSLPNVIGAITRQWVYGPICPREVLSELDSRCGDERMHQWFTDGGAEVLDRQIRSVTETARSSADPADFRARCLMLYGRPGHQLAIVFPVQ